MTPYPYRGHKDGWACMRLLDRMAISCMRAERPPPVARLGGLALGLITAAMVLFSATTDAAQSRLRVSATPANVAAGKKVKVRINGTRARRCTLTLRADRFRAKPYMQRRVGRRYTLQISPRSKLGPRIVTVRCGEARAYTSIRIGEARAGGPIGDDPLPDDFGEGLPPDEPVLGEFPPDEFPPGEFPPEELPVEEPPVEVSPPEITQPPVGTPPDTTAPSKPAGLSRTAATTASITLSWTASTDDVAVTGYSVYRGGTRIANPTATSYRFTGLTCGKSYALAVAAYDAAANLSPTATLTVATAACPARKVSVAKGDSAQGRPGCSSSYCRYVKVSFANYSSGSHTIVCRASGGDEGGFYTYTRTGGSNTSAVCYYGFPGRAVWATVDGVASAKVTW